MVVVVHMDCIVEQTNNLLTFPSCCHSCCCDKWARQCFRFSSENYDLLRNSGLILQQKLAPTGANRTCGVGVDDGNH